jgi:hypothetical protein
MNTRTPDNTKGPESWEEELRLLQLKHGLNLHNPYDEDTMGEWMIHHETRDLVSKLRAQAQTYALQAYKEELLHEFKGLEASGIGTYQDGFRAALSIVIFRLSDPGEAGNTQPPDTTDQT